MSNANSTAVGIVVAVLIIGAVATLGYYQFDVAANQPTTSASTAPAVQCPSAACANVTMPSGVGIPPSGYTGGKTTFGYSPDSITVVIGKNNTVFFANKDVSVHTVTSDSVPAGAQPFDSGQINTGGTFQVTLTVPGTYTYHCTIHAWMWGTIIVKAGSGSSSTTGSTASSSGSTTTTASSSAASTST